MLSVRTLAAERIAGVRAVADEFRFSRYLKSFLHSCIHCVFSINVPNDAEHYAGGELGESFECGHRTLDGFLVSPCPSDPRFPKFEEFDFDCRESGDVWTCYARPK